MCVEIDDFHKPTAQSMTVRVISEIRGFIKRLARVCAARLLLFSQPALEQEGEEIRKSVESAIKANVG